MIYKAIAPPKKRSAARKKLGKKLYIAKRFLQWHLSSLKFARNKGALLDCLIFSHQTLLLRKLKDVDMQLQYNKIENLKIAVKAVDGIIILPGETFSFWRSIGNPTPAKGYKLGMVLESGEVKAGYGGGLCQLSNLIYWMTLHTPLTVTERWRHSFDVFPDVNRTIPFGCGATVSYNYVDLQVTNHTERPFQLHVWLAEKYLCGEIRSDKEIPFSYEIFEKNHCIRQEISGYYSRHNQIIRKVTDKKTQRVVSEALLTENHAFMMYSPLIQEKN